MDTPADANQRLTKIMNDEDGDFDKESVPYLQAVGCLLFLTQGTRPDLAFAVNSVSRFSNCCGKSHWNAVKRIFRYLKQTMNLKLVYSRNSNGYIHGFTDADWATNSDTRKSCTGYVFVKSGGTICWSSKNQPTIALSTAEAEYMALSAGTQEALWLKQLDDELFGTCKPINISCDNQSMIKLVENNGYSARTKHIDIRHHFVKENVFEKKIVLHYVSTEKNPADALTKPLCKPKFGWCRNAIGLN